MAGRPVAAVLRRTAWTHPSPAESRRYKAPERDDIASLMGFVRFRRGTEVGRGSAKQTERI